MFASESPLPRAVARAWLAATLLLVIQPTLPAAEPPRVDFNFQIRPLLSDRCFPCHGPDAGSRKAKLRLDLQDGSRKALDDGWAVITPGNPEKSELVRRIFAEAEEDLMPPPASQHKLDPAEKELLKRWIAEGAEYQPHWAFRPLAKVVPPKSEGLPPIPHPIDAFVRAKLANEHLTPAPEASRELLLRRLTLDLTGLPPSLAELDGFLADARAEAYERAVDACLASPHYGERMAMDWLDLARFADTYGYQSDVDCDVWPWRDWVIQAFNQNLPYDQFIVWQLAGDLLPNTTREQRLATAFNRLHRQTNEGGSVEEEFRAEYCADRVNTVGTAMLGLTLGCARCHDHKFDPISQRGYYSMFAFFNSIDESGLYSHFTRATPTPTLLLWPGGEAEKHATLTNQIQQAELRLAAVVRESEGAFQTWLTAGGEVAPPTPLAHFTFDTITNKVTPDAINAGKTARLVDDPAPVPGAPAVQAGDTNLALQFNGDNQLVCESVPNFKRTDPFSFSLWLKPTESQERAVVLHQSRAWTDSGSRGLELVLDHGHPFVGLIHFWPGNAIGIRALAALPTNVWSHLTIAYDGTSRAAGLRLYLDGAPLATEVVRDKLSKDIVHRAQWGDAEVGHVHLQLAGRFRDTGFKGGSLDDLRVYGVCLTAAEARFLAGKPAATRPTQAELRDWFLARRHEPYQSAAAALQHLREQENSLIADVPEIMVMEELAQPRETRLLQRGAYDAPGEVVQRDTPLADLPFPNDQPRNRLGLARWMVDGSNPLTARVVVNRIWRMHFGHGLVLTEQDFGSQGRLPSHPELLDWLAGWFVDHHWDVKALHRLIVTSATYRQSSRAAREDLERDPDNRWLARGPAYRLQAETIRDSALAASGLLVRKIGGPGVKPYQPAGLWEQSGTGKTYTQDHGENLYRRSLYTFWRRTAPPPSMLTFDAVTREVCTANRETTATPLQALVLLNDPQFVEAARVLGERLLQAHPDDEVARIRGAFRLLTGRLPDESETAVLKRLLTEQRDFYAQNAAAAKQLLATGETKCNEALPPAELAANAMLVSAVMNHDEFVMKR